MKFVVHDNSVEVYFRDNVSCTIYAEPEDRVELINQIVALITKCSGVDKGADYMYVIHTMDGVKFECLNIGRDDKKLLRPMAEMIKSRDINSVTVFINGDITFMDLQFVGRIFDDCKGDFDIRWRCTGDYGKCRSVYSFFYR